MSVSFFDLKNMNLVLAVLFLLSVLKFSEGQSLCKCVCATCSAAPTMTTPPPAPGRTAGAGKIEETISASGCKQYTVTCYAAGTLLVSVGANGQYMSPESQGEKTAVLLCNDNRVIEGCTMSDDSVNVTQVYCSNTVPVCGTCGTLPMTDPPVSPGTARGTGTVTESIDGNGCKRYTVNCDASGINFVVVGANQQFTQLSAAGPGAKSANLMCDANGQIEGSDPAGNVVIANSVYCSYATPPGK